MDAATVRQDEDGKIGYGTFSGGILGNAKRAAPNITRVIGIDAPSYNVEPPPYPTPIVETGSGDFEGPFISAINPSRNVPIAAVNQPSTSSRELVKLADPLLGNSYSAMRAQEPARQSTASRLASSIPLAFPKRPAVRQELQSHP